MRKLIAVFLLLVFFLNLSGIFIAFKIQKTIIKNDVMQLLQAPGLEQELTVFTLSQDNRHLFEWEHEKEFRYNKVMYDIVKKEINSKGEIVMQCFADKKETKLWNDLSQLVKKNNPSHETINNLVKLLSSVFMPAEKNFIDLFQTTSSLKISFAGSTLSFEGDVLSPPPRLG